MPHLRAISSLKSLTSVIRTRLAPLALANCATRLPIVPAPDTTTFLPFKSPPRMVACAATATGSIIAP